MANAFLHGGTGGASLNFKITPYATKEALLAASPAENTIGVITQDKITSWVADGSAPAAPVEGMVWIRSGRVARIVINLLKKNAVYIYPQTVQQYVSEAWVSREAYCYQNKAWAPVWYGQLYTPGDEWASVTGGWAASAMKSTASSGAAAKAPTITRGTASIQAKNGNSSAGVFHTANKIDLTEFDTLTFRGELKRGGSAARNFVAACWPELGKYYLEGDGAPAAYKELSTTTAADITVNISALTGEHVVGLGLTESEANVTEVILSASNSAEAKAAAYDILMGGVTG